MSGPPVNVVYNGARTPLGTHAAASAAAYCAGINGTREHPFFLDQCGTPLLGAIDSAIEPGLSGTERLLALAEPALKEACEPLNDTGGRRFRVPLYLGLPAIRPGFSLQDVTAVRNSLSNINCRSVELADVVLFSSGHAAGFSALALAADKVREGACDVCLVGGVSSYFQIETLSWLDSNRQLVGGASRSGFVPGEGAGFCLIMSETARQQCGLPVLARVLAVATSQETSLIKTSDVNLGKGLTAAAEQVLDANGSSINRVDTVINDVNGERYRIEEWGLASLRLSDKFSESTTYHTPADCWGDVDAASCPLYVMLACQSAARKHTGGQHTLLLAGSENGLRGAAMLETAWLDD